MNLTSSTVIVLSFSFYKDNESSGLVSGCGAGVAARNGTHPSTTPLADAEAVVMTVEQVAQVLDLDALVEDGLDVAVVLVGLVLVTPAD